MSEKKSAWYRCLGPTLQFKAGVPFQRKSWVGKGGVWEEQRTNPVSLWDVSPGGAINVALKGTCRQQPTVKAIQFGFFQAYWPGWMARPRLSSEIPALQEECVYE